MAREELPRLIQWLREHGHTDSEIVDCIEFLETGRASQKDDE